MPEIDALPALRCARASFPEFGADPAKPPWKDCPPVWLRETIRGTAPHQSTAVRTLWDEDDWRVVFHVADTHIAATLNQRDAPLYTEEVVEVFFDPVGDLAGYFEIEVNPLNAVLDLVLRRNRNGYKKDFSWRCEGLRTVVRQEPKGWTVELAIPFRSVAAEPPRRGDLWRVNFARIDRPPNVGRELTAWSPTGFANFHVPERFGIMEFV